MSEKIETIISGDSKQLVRAIQEATKAAATMSNKLIDIGEKANGMSANVASAANEVEEISDALKEAGISATDAANKLETFGQVIAKSSNLTQLCGNLAKELALQFGATGGQAAIIAKGVESYITILSHFVKQGIEKNKEYGDSLIKNAEGLEKVSDENEKVRAATNGYFKELSNLAGAEELSNQQKLRQIQLLSLLRKGYADLAEEIAEGNLQNVDEVMAKKLDRDRDKRIKELNALYNEYDVAIEQQHALIDEIEESFITRLSMRGSGPSEQKAAGNKIASLREKQGEIQKELHDLRRATPGEDYLAQKKAERQDEIQAGIDKLKEDDQDKTLSTFEKQRKDLWRKLKPLFNNNELTDDQFKELVALKAKAEQRIKEAEILEMQKKEAEEQAKMEAEAAKERAAAEQYAKQRMAVEKKINDLLDEQKKRRLSQYDQQRFDVEKKYLALMDEAETSDELSGLNTWREGELQRIADEEANAAQKAAEEAAQNALKEKQKALEQAEKEAIASAERVANAEKRLTDAKLNYEKQQQEKQFREARERQNRQIQSLQGKIKSYDRQLASFGFSLGEGRMKRHTSASERNETRRNLRLDESISEKQAAQARGESVHFTNREWKRIREAEKIRNKKEQAEEKIEAIKAAQASQDAAKAAQEAAARQADAGKKMEDAAAELKKCKDEQANANKLQTEAAKAFQEAADSLNPKDGKAKQAATPEATTAAIGTVEGAATSVPRQVGKVAKSAVVQGNLPPAPVMTPTGNDIMKPLDTIIGLLQKLQSNVYIAR